MSELVTAAVIAAAPPTIAVLLATWVQTRALAAKVESRSAVVEDKVQEVHELANDRLTAALGKIEELQKALRERSA